MFCGGELEMIIKNIKEADTNFAINIYGEKGSGKTRIAQELINYLKTNKLANLEVETYYMDCFGLQTI